MCTNMLTRQLATCVALVTVALSVLAVPSPASASDGSGGCSTSQLSPTCTVAVGNGGSNGSSDQGGNTGAPVNFSPLPASCTYQGQAVTCQTSDGWWSNQPGNCIGYVQLAPPAEQSVPPSGESAGVGAWYVCTAYCPPPVIGGRDCYGGTFWSDVPPAGITTYTPAQAAALLVKSFPLIGITIGMAPEDKTHTDDPVGTAAYRRTWVGIPVWLWVQNPQPQNFGPYSKSATLGGVTVTATAQVQSVTWSSGDGQMITCGAGTAFDETAMQDELATDSPTCGFRYQKTSGTLTFTVMATSNWIVRWAGGGTNGTTAVPTVRSATQIHVGQLESVNTVTASDGIGY
jgi:hypothetical protein